MRHKSVNANLWEESSLNKWIPRGSIFLNGVELP